jgi:hypothetical protein
METLINHSTLIAQLWETMTKINIPTTLINHSTVGDRNRFIIAI